MFATKDATRLLTQLSRSALRTKVAPTSARTVTSFSNTISFASPDSDFSTSHVLIKSTHTDFDYQRREEIQNDNDRAQSVDTEWTGALLFSSPESDFTSGDQTRNDRAQSVDAEWTGTLSFSSPESDFTSEDSLAMSNMNTEQEEAQNNNKAKDAFFQTLEQSSPERNDVAYSLSFASAESDFTNPEFTQLLTERQKKQLSNTASLAKIPNHDEANQFTTMREKKTNQVAESDLNELEYQELRAHANLLSHEEALPFNMDEATIEGDARAIVVTEAQVPFHIVNVNSAWEGLCGFTKDECHGKTLNCIQGDETNQAAVTALMSQLLRGEEAGTILTNYRKDGSKFQNRLRVRPLRDENNSVTHFVGVLKEVQEMSDYFEEGSKISA